MRRHEDPTQERAKRIADLRQQLRAIYDLAKRQTRDLNEQEEYQAEQLSERIAEELNETLQF